MTELFIEVINTSISASWLILFILILRLFLQKSPKWISVMLWGIVALKLIFPFSIESPISFIPASIVDGTILSEWMDDYIGAIDIHSEDSIYYDAAIGAGREPISSGENSYYVVTKHDQLGEPSTIRNTIMPVLSVVWLFGIMLLLLYTTLSYWRLCRKVNTAVRYKDNIFQSETIKSPFVLGIIKPKIYLPFKIDEQSLKHVIAHEHAHILRKDHLWKPLGFLLLSIHWFNPLLWLSYILLCRDIELACDEKVIQNLNNEGKADYTQALVTCSVNHHILAACPLAFGEVGVKNRVVSIMNYRKPTFWIIILSVLSCVIVAICFLTNPKEYSVYDVFSMNKYTVLEQKQIDLALSVPKIYLSDDAYTSEGQEFEKDKVIAYQTDSTTIYLHKVMLSNESDDLLYFIFDFSYDFSNYGSFISPFCFAENSRNVTSPTLYLYSKDLKDINTIYPDALSMRGHGPGTQFTFYVSKEACQSAEKKLQFDIICNEIFYAKPISSM